MKYQTRSERCLGIDPGLANCGWAVVGRNASGKYRLLDHGCIETTVDSTESERALSIYQKISEVIGAHMPNMVAIERVFFNKNVSSAITTGGVVFLCLLAAEQAGIESLQVKPQSAKAAIGFATADKSRVQQMVSKLTGVSVKNVHAADAAAVAIAGLLRGKRIDSKVAG